MIAAPETPADPTRAEPWMLELLAGSTPLIFGALPRRLRAELAGDTPG